MLTSKGCASHEALRFAAAERSCKEARHAVLLAGLEKGADSVAEAAAAVADAVRGERLGVVEQSLVGTGEEGGRGRQHGEWRPVCAHCTLDFRRHVSPILGTGVCCTGWVAGGHGCVLHRLGGWGANGNSVDLQATASAADLSNI